MELTNVFVEAAGQGNYKSVQLILLKSSEYVDVVSSNGDTALIAASTKGHINIVNLLLSYKANVDVKNSYQRTALMLAAKEGHVQVAKAILNYKRSSIDIYTSNKDSALTEACFFGHLHMVQLLLTYRFLMSKVPHELGTAMLKASKQGHINVAKILLNYGASVQKNTYLDESPLTIAAYGSSNNVGITLFLLENRARINDINRYGYTPVQVAIMNNQKDVVSILLRYGASMDVLSIFNIYDMEDILRPNSVRFDAHNNQLHGLTLLMLAARLGFTEIGKLLLQHGANPNAVAALGRCSCTALKLAASKGHLPFVKILLRKHANVNSIDRTGNTPIWYAAKNGHLEVVQELYNNGGAINFRNNICLYPTCLIAAIKYGKIDVVGWVARHIQEYPTDEELGVIFNRIPFNDIASRNIFLLGMFHMYFAKAEIDNRNYFREYAALHMSSNS